MLSAEVGLRLGSLELDFKLTAGAGDVLALLGPNGAGKTTLLRAVAGLQRIDQGQIQLDGTVLDAPATGRFVPAEDRSVGFVFQDYLLFPHLSVLENVAFGLRAHGQNDAQLEATGWLKRVGLAEYASARPAQLSGGQGQRVALARALAPNPRLLLLDEPLAALDASTRVTVRRDLKKHLSQFEGITLLVTHDPVDAAALAGNVMVIEGGRAVQSGTLPEITARPRSRYVADLVGVNLWRGTAADGLVQLGDATITAGAGQNGDVFALVHPRAISLYLVRPQGSPRNVWRGVASSLDAMADRVRVRVDGPVPLVAEITNAGLADLGLIGGEEVWISFKASEVDVYPA